MRHHRNTDHLEKDNLEKDNLEKDIEELDMPSLADSFPTRRNSCGFANVSLSFLYNLARFLKISYFLALFEQVEEPHKAEIVTSLKGTVIRCAEESADMYKSIDEVCDRLVSVTILFYALICASMRLMHRTAFRFHLSFGSRSHVYLFIRIRCVFISYLT